MKLHDIISISLQVLENILIEEAKKIPGIDNKSIETIKTNDDNCEINVYLTPFNILTSVSSLAKELQQAISFYLCKQFDVTEGRIKINIFIDANKEGGK
ncbi:MAG: hypothetical protein MJ223_03705 [Mycoplasmoidaceae bacterium]|nr:hypothetical protein [Mycoplasmoidaceae bacterium]